MKMLGTNLCIKCENAEKQLKEAGIQFDYVDFTNSIMYLKEFPSSTLSAELEKWASHALSLMMGQSHLIFTKPLNLRPQSNTTAKS